MNFRQRITENDEIKGESGKMEREKNRDENIDCSESFESKEREPAEMERREWKKPRGTRVGQGVDEREIGAKKDEKQ